MSDVEKRIAHLEDLVEELQLHSHASRIAIAVLSTALNGVVGKETHLGDVYLEGVSKADPIEFDIPAKDGYLEKLNERVAALLGRAQ